MRLVRQDNGSYLEVYDIDRCTDCGQRFNPYRAVKGFRPCMCVADGGGHRLLTCPGCGAKNEDPPHVPQYGPSASYGGVSTHRPMRDGTAPT